MAFGLSAVNLPHIRSYEKAHAWFLACLVNKQDPQWKYLYRKHDKTKLMRLDPVTEDIICRYHDTNVVTWHKDDTVTINLGSYGYSRSTGVFIEAISGFDLWRDHKNENNILGSNVRYKRWCIDTVAKVDAKDGRLLSGEVPRKKKRVNRTIAKEAMKPWAHVVAHIRALVILNGGYVHDNNPATYDWPWGSKLDALFDAGPPSLETTHEWICKNIYHRYSLYEAINFIRKNIYDRTDGAWYIQEFALTSDRGID